MFGVQDDALGTQGDPDESIQGYCFRLCLTKHPANRIAIEKPSSYDPSHYELQRRYLAAGGVISAPGADRLRAENSGRVFVLFDPPDLDGAD